MDDQAKQTLGTRTYPRLGAEQTRLNQAIGDNNSDFRSAMKQTDYAAAIRKAEARGLLEMRLVGA